MDDITTLYMQGVHGINTWSISSLDGVIYINAHGRSYHETVEEGKSGRSRAEQIRLRVNARIRNKLDQGYKRNLSDVGKHVTNQLGLPAPMLATLFSKMKGVDLSDMWVQPKLDGHRCLITRYGAYSRRGKPIDTIPEILAQLDIPEGIILDGELYCHGQPLQTISSWAKRRQENTKKLQFHCYDAIIDGVPFHERLDEIKEVVPKTEFTTVVCTMLFNQDVDVYDYFEEYRRMGYEGAILRQGDGLYGIGKRTKDLIKVKKRFDGEFECVDIIPDRLGNGVLVLMASNGSQFKTVAPGDNYQKLAQLEQKEKFIGRYVTCEYAELTKDGIPFHCVAIRWREEL